MTKTILHQPSQPVRQLMPNDKVPSEHPLADAFPHMTEFRWKLFLEDVRARGRIVEPVVLVQNGATLLLDGRHRLRAARVLGMPCPAIVLPSGEDPAEFVLRKNASASRTLTALERARAAIAVHEWKREGSDAKLKQTDLAAMAGVSTGTAAKALLEHRGRVNARVPKPENAPRGDLSIVDKSPHSGSSKPAETPEKLAQREQQSAQRTEGTHATAPEGDGEPEKLPELDVIRIQRDVLAKKVDQLTSDLADATEDAEFWRDQGNPESAIREKVLNNQREEIRSLRQQLAEWQTKSDEFRREALALRRELKKAGLEE